MFLDHEITLAECRSALDAALGSLLPRLRVEQRASLHDLILANEGIVMRAGEGPDQQRKFTR